MVLTVISAQNLPKDGYATNEKIGEIIDPFVRINIDGFEADRTTLSTSVLRKNGFNPCWNESFTITVSNPELAVINFQVYDADFWSAEDYIGHFGCSISMLRQGYRMVPLLDPLGQFIKGASLLIHVAPSEKSEKSIRVPYYHPKPFDPLTAQKIAKPLGFYGVSSLDGLDLKQLRNAGLGKEEPQIVDSLMEIPATKSSDRDRCCTAGVLW